MKAIVTRQSGETGIVDIYPARQGIPTEVLERRILEALNLPEDVKSNPFYFCKDNEEAKALESKIKNNYYKNSAKIKNNSYLCIKKKFNFLP